MPQHGRSRYKICTRVSTQLTAYSQLTISLRVYPEPDTDSRLYVRTYPYPSNGREINTVKFPRRSVLSRGGHYLLSLGSDLSKCAPCGLAPGLSGGTSSALSCGIRSNKEDITRTASGPQIGVNPGSVAPLPASRPRWGRTPTRGAPSDAPHGLSHGLSPTLWHPRLPPPNLRRSESILTGLA